MENTVSTSGGRPRIVSLDQFRGYTVLGMFLVNFVGGLDASHYLLRHHNTFCSYADTIMPQFFFAVGFAFRLTFCRRVETDGPRTAYFRVIRRLLGLILVALVVYSVDRGFHTWRELTEQGFWEAIRTPLKRDWFQTLTHIAVTSLWVLPVIRARAAIRIAFMLGSAGLHALLSHVFYFRWLHTAPSGIDGGPLGFLTWTIPVIIGTLACDVIVRAESRRRILPLAIWGVVLMALGYLLSCGATLYNLPADGSASPAVGKMAANPVVPSRAQLEAAGRKLTDGHWTELLAEPPFVPPPHPPGEIDRSYERRQGNYWMMSQKAGTISYLTFASGFSLAVYALFYLCCDRWGRQLGVLRTLGMNALAAYVLHMLVEAAIRPFVPSDAPGWYAWGACILFLAITYALVRSLERQNIYLKL